MAAIQGCSGKGNSVTTIITPPPGTAPVTLVMTDTPPAGVTVLSFQVTLTGAVLSPGNVSLLSTPVAVEIKHLETENLVLNTNVTSSGNYTSLAFTFANPSLTFKNDTGAPFLVGGTNCAAGAACQFAPVMSPSTKTFTGSPFVQIFPGASLGILVDVNLNNVLSGSLGVDFTAPSGVTATILPLTGQNVSFPTVEDLIGQVTSRDGVNLQFTLQTSLTSYTVKTDANTLFQDFLSGGCSSANFGCVLTNQIVGVDAILQSDGSLLAKRVELKDVDGSESEVDGVVFALSGPSQFGIVITDVFPAVAGLSPGTVATVNAGVATTFDVDNEGQNTVPLLFNSMNDLLVGQAVQVKRLSTSLGVTLNADRVRLRGSRFTAMVATTPSSGIFTVNALPSLFTSAGTTQIEVRTSATTELEGTSSIGSLLPGNTVSLRGQLFRNGANFPALVTSKVRKH